ncbi:capping protein inhibiting regulator of actin dynamics [Episyrphus balteatus]|uniref:capping protein inhibiting regulator of actin dynamics n=1 Tax=Episyrphus balteatus TaxID=286459 RepID=UPI002484EE90|nr:capping protein inhibiting regulator of actin dynamics [Episyrphus balteatus]
MGCACCKDSSEETELMPSVETRRKLQEEAAEKRRQENEQRGIKDPEKFRRQQERAEELERREKEAEKYGGAPTLKWQQD